MQLKHLAAFPLAVTLSVTPVLAQANGTGALDSDVRAGASLSDESALDGMGTGFYIIGAIALALVIYGIIELTDDDGDPVSP